MSDQDSLGVYARRTGESQKAFAAYCEYRDMGAERSIESVHRKLGKSSRLLARWSSQWGWVERAAAYDAHLAEEEQKAREYAYKKEAQKWAERLIALKEGEWHKGEALEKRAELMMQFPLQTVERTTTEESKDGKTVIINTTTIKPTNWRAGDVTDYYTLADQFRRKSCGMETSRTTVQGIGEGRAMLVENIEEIRRKRWQEAMPAFMAMIREELGTVGDAGAEQG